jgi:uncharacterized membrane protein YtjA (UPF0391 family)
MLRAAIFFFIIAIIAAFFGFGGVAGESASIGKILLFVFLALAIISYVVSLAGGGRRNLP